MGQLAPRLLDGLIRKGRTSGSGPARGWFAGSAAALVSVGSSAAGISVDDPDWSLRWDNTIKLSAMARVAKADGALADSTRLLVPGVSSSAFPQALNFNAGDDNFRRRGLVSERVDLLSEFDAVYQRRFGVRLSGAGWYDAAYHRNSDAVDPLNGQTPENRFPKHTREMAGGKAELLDAFVFGAWELEGGRRLSARLGQHALQYGESLFYGDNGIARAQGPIDVAKLLASPNAQFKEIIRPVPQVSAQLQLSADVSVGAYYQFQWESDRLPAAGSYFSTVNVPWGSSQPEYINVSSGALAGQYVLKADRLVEPSNSGQYGMQVKWRAADTDLGVYLARYHDKSGQLYGDLNVAAPQDSRWFYVFPAAVKTVGASASHSFGDVNLAGEASLRWDMPLRSQNILYPSALSPQPAYATGKTAHINLSWLATLGPNWLANESSFVGELAWHRVLSRHDPDHELDPARSRDATALQFVFSPSYRQVLPGVDLSVPVGLRYTLDGHSPVIPWESRGSGSASLGLEGNYLGVWQFTLNYTRYIGSAVPFLDYRALLSGGSTFYSRGNPLADRDYVAVSLRRTF
ncbi:DUF1302 family protein [Roseateles sp. SL47]|uniref:DUF1302 domain-containing protein n=1 Tax=Roseateles sp. SL47 TaxID=2995138 RepID=UPI002270C37E|nr:DUF1302 family protein [Roseateles sp. SL47]WAC75858.1 DUF1302 family protein [Roseateles sp. SL47]